MAKRTRRIWAALTLCAGAAALSAAALAAAAQAPETPSAEPALPPAVEKALEQVRAGDLAGAIAGLEAVHKAPNPPGPAVSLLGALYLEANRPTEALAVLAPLAAGADADPAVLFHAGRAALALDRGEEGERYLLRSAAKAPRSEAVRVLGLRRARQGQTLSAYALLLPWVRANPEDVPARLAAALCAVDLDRAAEARELVARLPQEAPRVRLLQAQILGLEGDARGALALAEPLLAAHPPEIDSEVKALAADLYLRLGRPADAAPILATVKTLDPPGALLLARARRELGDLAACERLLDPHATAVLAGTLRAGAAERASILSEHGRCTAGLQQWPEAIASLRGAVALTPDDAALWRLLAAALRASGQSAEAARADQALAGLAKAKSSTAATLPPGGDAIDTAVAAAFALAQQGRMAQAIERLDIEAELAPGDDPRPLIARGVLLLQAGRAADALRSAEAAVTRSPESAVALHLRGAALMGSGDWAGAERDLRAALGKSPDFAPALGDLAVLLLERGRAAEAVSLLERLATLQPNDEAVRRSLAQARKRVSGG